MKITAITETVVCLNMKSSISPDYNVWKDCLLEYGIIYVLEQA